MAFFTCVVCSAQEECVYFKQKTAYELRISDWSSDVCSSDLPRGGGRRPRCAACLPVRRPGAKLSLPPPRRPPMKTVKEMLAAAEAAVPRIAPEEAKALVGRPDVLFLDVREPAEVAASRSEEHTSELQSLMRISYAVFCLNKNKD